MPNPFRERVWRRAHNGGWREELHQSDENWFVGYLQGPTGEPEIIQEGTHRDQVAHAVRSRLLAVGHGCDGRCGPLHEVGIG